ncbi:mCG1043585, partial [Mus musculus]
VAFQHFCSGFAILKIHPSQTLSHAPSPSVALCHGSEKCLSPDGSLDPRSNSLSLIISASI